MKRRIQLHRQSFATGNIPIQFPIFGIIATETRFRDIPGLRYNIFTWSEQVSDFIEEKIQSEVILSLGRWERFSCDMLDIGHQFLESGWTTYR